jgi:hypothetical protein
MAEPQRRDESRDDPRSDEWRPQPDAEPDWAEEHDSLTVADDPLDKPAESDAR